ncbi:transposase [Stenotrophomonas pavanii]|uniref:transposase n=1 Tax=Stenotrophomonas pavanii TaxID=487698 RepID=UPI003BB04602
MKSSCFAEEQIAYALWQVEPRTAVGEKGVAEATFYMWRKKYSGLSPFELKQLRLLEKENCELKQLVADLSLDKAILQEVVTKSSEASPVACLGGAGCRSDLVAASGVRCGSCRCRARLFPTRPRCMTVVPSAGGCMR